MRATYKKDVSLKTKTDMFENFALELIAETIIIS